MFKVTQAPEVSGLSQESKNQCLNVVRQRTGIQDDVVR